MDSNQAPTNSQNRCSKKEICTQPSISTHKHNKQTDSNCEQIKKFVADEISTTKNDSNCKYNAQRNSYNIELSNENHFNFNSSFESNSTDSKISDNCISSTTHSNSNVSTSCRQTSCVKKQDQDLKHKTRHSSNVYEKICSLVYENSNLDFETLRSLCQKGIPTDLRSYVQKLLLGYLPSNQNRRQSILSKRRLEYQQYVDLYQNVDHKHVRTDHEKKMMRQILVDVPRTNPDSLFFKHKSVQEMLERILFVWSIKHPATGYVQGINDILIPFVCVFFLEALREKDSEYNCECIEVLSNNNNNIYHLDDLTSTFHKSMNEILTLHHYGNTEIAIDFLSKIGCRNLELSLNSTDTISLCDVEADVFQSMSKLLEGIQDHYIFAQPGLQRMVFKLKKLVQRIDEPLCRHFDQQGLQFIQFAFRQMNCLLLREIPLFLIIRLQDTYFSLEKLSFTEFHIYVCAALLVRYSNHLQTLEFQDLVMFLQHLPTQNWRIKDVESLISHAYVLQTLFHGAQSHLN